MADSPTLPLTGSGDSTVRVSTEEITTLNGGAVSAEHIQRVVPAARTADGTAVDIGHAEDSAHASGHAGIMALAVRKDTAAALAGTDGDYAPLEVDADGKLHVQTGTVAVTNSHLTSLGGAVSGTEVQVDVVGALPAGTNAIGKLAANSGVDIGDVDVTSVVPGTGATNLGKAEDAAHTSGDVGVMALAVRFDAGGALAGTDGDYTPLQVDSAGALRVTGGGGGTQYTEGDTDASITGTAMLMEGAGNALVAAQGTASDGLLVNLGSNNDVTLGAALPAGTNNIGDVDVLSVPAPLSTTGGGTEASALRVTIASDSTGVVSIDDNGGTITVDGTVTANAGTGTRTITGDVAHDAADSGNPVKVGGKARTTNPTAVADADRVDATFDDIGRQVVVLNQVRDLVVHQHTQIASSSSETTIVTAGAAGVFHDLTHLIVTNQTATAVNVTIKDATAGTTRMIIALAANGGAVIPFSVPVPQASAANNWTATLSSASVTVNIFAQAVKNV